MARNEKKAPPEKKGSFGQRRVRRPGEPTALDLVEEGVHLLRRIALKYWTVYLLGAVPFVLGFLYFWAEMASSGLAESVLLPASVGLAGLFLWMKFTQAYFAKGLRATLLGAGGEPWGLAVAMRVGLRQAIWQPTGFVVLPLAFVVTLPFAWCFAFYQNLLVSLPTHGEEGGRLAEQWRLARMWHEQSWMTISLLTLVFFLVWLNCLSVVSFGPYLLKTLLGVETVFSRVGWNLFNSTTFFSCFMVSYLVTDPLTKAVFFLRQHYCESRQTGADLRLRMRRAMASARTGMLALLLVVFAGLFGPQSQARAEDSADPIVLEADALDASIEKVMQRREFVWRFSREEAMDSGEHWLSKWVEKIEAFQERIRLWLEKFFDREERRDSDRSLFDGNFAGLADLISYLLIAAFVLIVVYFAVRAWRVYQASEMTAVEEAGDGGAVPDLESEDVDASLLPRNRWVELARELIAKGEYRLGLRAYFLAQLSAFSSEGLILIRKAKSNREYANELSRRGHPRADLLPLYRNQMRLFESVWYGGRAAGEAEISEMEDYLKGQGVLS